MSPMTVSILVTLFLAGACFPVFLTLLATVGFTALAAFLALLTGGAFATGGFFSAFFAGAAFSVFGAFMAFFAGRTFSTLGSSTIASGAPEIIACSLPK